MARLARGMLVNAQGSRGHYVEPPATEATVLDDFDRANGPLGADWASPIQPGRGSADILTNSLRVVSTYVDSYWNYPFESDQAVFFDVAATVATVTNHNICCWIQNPNTASDGMVYLFYEPDIHLFALGQQLPGGSTGNLPVDQRTANITLEVGDRYGLTVDPTGLMFAWIRKVGTTKWMILLAGQTSVTAPASSYIGVSGNTVMRLDNMGGGGVAVTTKGVVSARRPQRYLLTTR